MDFYQPSANQQNLLNSTMIMPDSIGPVNPLASNFAGSAAIEEATRTQLALHAQINELKKKNFQLETEIGNLKREAESFEINCQIKQLEFESEYVKNVEHKLIRVKQEREQQLKQHIEDLTNTKTHMEAHFKEMLDQKDHEIDEMRNRCGDKKELEDKIQRLQDDLEMTQRMNLGLIEQLEISKVELDQLRSAKSSEDQYDDEIKQCARLLREIRAEEQDHSNNNAKMIENLNKSGKLLASALESDENSYAFKEMSKLDRSGLVERVQTFAKLVIKQQQILRDTSAETRAKMEKLEKDLKSQADLNEALAQKLSEKNKQIVSLSKTISEMRHHTELLEETHEKLTYKLGLFEQDLVKAGVSSNLELFFKEMESCVIGLHEVSEYFFAIYNNNNQTSDACKIKREKKKIQEFFSKGNAGSCFLELLDPKFISSKLNEFKELKLKLNDVRTFAGLINLNDI